MDTGSNVYNDQFRAESYAQLEFPGTYFLAFRDLPEIISRHVEGTSALDFGCGTGRSTRFLKGLGFEVVGVDISANMIDQARKADPDGVYLLLPDGALAPVEGSTFDLVLAAFPFDNIPGRENRARILGGLSRLLSPKGRIVILGSTPEIYVHEWTSFSTRDFPENRSAKSGEEVRIVMKDVPDSRPVIDQYWLHEDYLDLFEQAGMDLVAEHRPLGRADEPYPWISETEVAPWVIYVLRKAS